MRVDNLKKNILQVFVFALDSRLLPCTPAGKVQSDSALSHPELIKCGFFPSANSPSHFAAKRKTVF